MKFEKAINFTRNTQFITKFSCAAYFERNERKYLYLCGTSFETDS